MKMKITHLGTTTAVLVAAMVAISGCGGQVEQASDTGPAGQTFLKARRGKLSSWFGPWTHRASGSSFYDIMFEVPETFVGHCVQNGGAGEFESHDTGATYRCSLLLTDRAELTKAGISNMDQLGHWYYEQAPSNPNPNWANPDRGSVRYRTSLEEERFSLQYSKQTSYFQLGSNMADFYYKGSPAGADGYYYAISIDCSPIRPGTKGTYSPDSPPISEVKRQCDPAEMKRIAREETRGAGRILVLGIDSVYF